MRILKAFYSTKAIVIAGLLLLMVSCSEKPSFSSRFGGSHRDEPIPGEMPEWIRIFLLSTILLSLACVVVDYLLTYYNNRKKRSIIKYGQELETVVFPIGGEENWHPDEALKLGKEIREKVFSGLKTRMSNQSHNDSRVTQDAFAVSGSGFRYRIKDNEILIDHGFPKTFLKAEFSHHSGHTLSFYVNYQLVGNFLVAHHLVFLKGKNKVWKLILFWFFLPKLLLFKYMFKRGGLVKDHINVIDPSFFDTMDLNAFWTTCHESIMESTEEILKEKGLMTEQIQTILNQSITNHNISNTQNVNVSGSGNSMRGFNQSHSGPN